MTTWIEKILSPQKKKSVISNSKTEPTEKKEIKLQEWPSNNQLVSYEDLVFYIKKVLFEGYKLTRIAQNKSFDYEGYDVGDSEKAFVPSLLNRFKEEHIAAENKQNRKLIDIILNSLYLLGVENGRRVERKKHTAAEKLLEIIDNVQRENRLLKEEIAAIQPVVFPNEFLERMQADKNRFDKINALKKSLSSDPIRSAFTPASGARASFYQLVSLGKTLNCTHEHWASVLKKNGWDVKDFWQKTQKKGIKLKFS